MFETSAITAFRNHKQTLVRGRTLVGAEPRAASHVRSRLRSRGILSLFPLAFMESLNGSACVCSRVSFTV